MRYTPTDFIVIPQHPGDRGCTPVTPGRTPVKYWTPAGAVRKGVLQNYIRMLRKTRQIDESEYKTMYPKNAKVGRAHGSAKIHKDFERIPPLRPIIDTIGSTHYGVGKFVSQLLNPLTKNEYSLKDSFEAAERIKAIPQAWYDEGYKLISFEVTSLFTNVPLHCRLKRQKKTN